MRNLKDFWVVTLERPLLLPDMEGTMLLGFLGKRDFRVLSYYCQGVIVLFFGLLSGTDCAE
jgi:hypothetical protein